MKRTHRWLRRAGYGAIGCAGLSAFADPPPPRRPDPISLDRQSPSVIGFGNRTADIFGENPPAVFLGFGWDVGGPGPILHVNDFNYGLGFLDNTDGISNGEFRPTAQQVLYFSGSDTSQGAPGTPYRNQFVRQQAAGDRWVTNGFLSQTPLAVLAGAAPAVVVGPGVPLHVLSANQTRFNEIPSIPPPAFNAFAAPAGATRMDDMDGLEITPIDLNGDNRHDTRLYFTLDAASPALGAGLSPADVLYSPPGAAGFLQYAPRAALGLRQGDDVDALAVWDFNDPRRPDSANDVAIFSLRPGSPSLAGPDGVTGTADDFSAADVFVTRFTGFFRLYVRAASLGLRFQDDIDALDVEPRFAGPQFRDWWVQRFNIDVPLCPQAPPANDFHVDIQGIQPNQVRNLWVGSFPNAEIVPIPGGTRINWTGAVVPPGGVAHFGWEIIDDSPVQRVDMYYTLNGQRITVCRPIPDVVQTWRTTVDGPSTQVVDVIINRSPFPVRVQRRAIATPRTISLDDLLVESELTLRSQPVDPQPIILQPMQELPLPFEYDIDTLGYAVIYQASPLDTTDRPTVFLTALTVEQSDDADLPFGACCFDDGCLELGRAVCESNGGRYRGDGSACDGAACGTGGTPGDMNCDGAVDFNDLDGFVVALVGQAGYEAAYPDCRYLHGDTDGDGDVDFDDINGFVRLLVGG